MGWYRTREWMAVATHESGHATAALLLDVPVLYARIDQPESDLAGLVMTRHTATPLGLEKQLACVLAGPLATMKPIDWPVTQDDEGDAHAAWILSEVLGLDGPGFLRVESLARQLLRTAIGRCLQSDLSSALLDHGYLAGEQVYEIAERAGSSEIPAVLGS